jgi:hypothetical protein
MVYVAFGADMADWPTPQLALVLGGVTPDAPVSIHCLILQSHNSHKTCRLSTHSFPRIRSEFSGDPRAGSPTRAAPKTPPAADSRKHTQLVNLSFHR